MKRSPTFSTDQPPRIYAGDGDKFMATELEEMTERILLLPDTMPSKVPDLASRIRVLWGQHLLEDLLAGRYRTLVCAVNAEDNRRGIIAQLAALLPTSQWDERSITAYVGQFAGGVKVVKVDMDAVEVLAVLRPSGSTNLTLTHLSAAFRIVAEMVRRHPGRTPSASVSFLGARANALRDHGSEPCFEAVLRTMYDAGYTGDVYPPPALWQPANSGSPVGVFARFPFPEALNRLREGGF